MQERRLRLGDVLDDYCPREKRLSNHVIVALVDDEVRTTRCATCDFEHVYKGGKVPARRKKAEPQAALYKTVLENITGRDADTGAPLVPVGEPDAVPVAAAPPVAPPVARVAAPVAAPPPPASAAVSDAATDAESVAGDDAPHEEPVHRHQLIRATLPKVEGQVPERKPADFTLWNVARHPQGRRGGAGSGGGGGRHRPQAAGNSNWGGYSPYANGHPSGKGPQQGQGGGQPQGKGGGRHRRGR